MEESKDYITNNLDKQFVLNESAVEARLQRILSRLIQKLKEGFDPSNPMSVSTKKSRSTTSPSLYHGWGGIVEAMFLHKSEFPHVQFDQLVEKMISVARKDREMQFAGYYMGMGGVLVTACKIWRSLGYQQKVESAAREIVELAQTTLSEPLDYHELLYGTAGVLYSVLSVSKCIQCDQLIFDLVRNIIDAGHAAYKSGKDGQPYRLVYYFHESEYLGAAHGLIGVIHILLQAILHLANSNTFKPLITNKILDPIYNSLNFLLHLQYSDGNFPSSVKDYHIGYLQSNRSTPYKAPKLTQFCHGATGFVAPLRLATKVLNNFPSDIVKSQTLVNAAEKAAQHVWEKGLLKKGYNLCHGIVGSVCSLQASSSLSSRASLLCLSRDIEEIQQTIEGYDTGNRYTVGSSDFPMSLMEGLAGEILVCTDVMRRGNTGFPGYDVCYV